MDIEEELAKARKLREQRAAANKRYQSKQAQIGISLSHAENEAIRKRAAAAGLSLKQYIVKKCLE